MVKHAMSLFSVDVINPDMTGRPAHARIGERIRMPLRHQNGSGSA
jgi:hypothetical protein